MPLTIADYSALTSNIYHFDSVDQAIELDLIGGGLTSLDNVRDALDQLQTPTATAIVQAMTVAGFTFASDGFVYSPRGLLELPTRSRWTARS